MYMNRTICPIGLTGMPLAQFQGGLRCGPGGCKCGGKCAGLGRHHAGMGLFDTADFTTWGWGEWATIGVGVYLVMSLAGDTKRAVKTTHRTSKRIRRRLGDPFV